MYFVEFVGFKIPNLWVLKFFFGLGKFMMYVLGNVCCMCQFVFLCGYFWVSIEFILKPANC